MAKKESNAQSIQARKKRAATIAARKKKERIELLTELARTPIIAVACKRAGIPPSTYYRWIQDDLDFARAAEEARQEGVSNVNDLAESVVLSKIRDKDMGATRFWLSHHHASYGGKEHPVHSAADIPPEVKQSMAKAMKAWIPILRPQK